MGLLPFIVVGDGLLCLGWGGGSYFTHFCTVCVCVCPRAAAKAWPSACNRHSSFAGILLCQRLGPALMFPNAVVSALLCLEQVHCVGRAGPWEGSVP